MGDLVASHICDICRFYFVRKPWVCSRQTGLLLSNHTALCQPWNMLQFCLLQDDWSLKHTTIPKTAAQTLHFSFHSVNFGDQFPSPNLDFSWFFWEITFSLVSPPFLFVLSQRETTAAPMNHCHSTQGRWRSVEGFRSQTIWNTRGNENLRTDHPKSDPQTRLEIRRGSGAHFFHSNFILWVTPQYHLWDAFPKRFCGTTATLLKKTHATTKTQWSVSLRWFRRRLSPWKRIEKLDDMSWLDRCKLCTNFDPFCVWSLILLNIFVS